MVVVSGTGIVVIDICVAASGDDDLDDFLYLDVYVEFGDIHSMEIGK